MNNPKYNMVVMGASTGGPQSVKIVLGGLPRDFPLGIVYVQHIEDSFYAHYAEWLDGQTELHVRLARDGDYPAPGEVLVAPAGSHLVFRDGRLVLDDAPPVMSIRPSVDSLFLSASRQFGGSLIGVLMTGMGKDGALGCAEIKSHGGYTIAQDEATSVIFGMARNAIELGGISIVLPAGEISRQLVLMAEKHS
jgi:two-component system, chemotaxis family, protein-glutamate methylesterase/glutaminase